MADAARNILYYESLTARKHFTMRCCCKLPNDCCINKMASIRARVKRENLITLSFLRRRIHGSSDSDFSHLQRTVNKQTVGPSPFATVFTRISSPLSPSYPDLGNIKSLFTSIESCDLMTSVPRSSGIEANTGVAWTDVPSQPECE